MKTKSRFSVVVVAMLAIGTISGGLMFALAGDVVQGQLRSSVASAHIEHANDLSRAFRHVAKTVQPSVVSISSVKRMQLTSARPDQSFPELPDEFRRFFGDDVFRRFEQTPRQSPGRNYEQKGLGTGVIISADGYILTNNHVVADADEVTVTLQDERRFDASVVGTDPKSDLAVLRIEASGLIAAPLGNSDKLEVGDWVLAVGSPFGLTQTVTAGIVSATGRANMGITDYEDFVQTDAAINPGNSGGPLVNMRGEVIGINTAIASRSGGYNGIGFAIPSNMAKSIKDAIITNGRVDRGQLGAVIQNLTKDMSQSFGFNGSTGVLISDVIPDSAAAKAGLESGDIVLKFSGQEIRDMNQLRNAVAATAPGTRVELVIFRNGTEQTVKVEVARLEGTTVAVNGGSTSSKELGAKLRSLTGELATELGYASDQRGVVVTEVEPGGLAVRAGLRPRDVILSINGKKIAKLADFTAAMKELDLSDGVRLQVLSDNVRRFVFIRAR